MSHRGVQVYELAQRSEMDVPPKKLYYSRSSSEVIRPLWQFDDWHIGINICFSLLLIIFHRRGSVERWSRSYISPTFLFCYSYYSNTNTEIYQSCATLRTGTLYNPFASFWCIVREYKTNEHFKWFNLSNLVGTSGSHLMEIFAVALPL